MIQCEKMWCESDSHLEVESPPLDFAVGLTLTCSWHSIYTGASVKYPRLVAERLSRVCRAIKLSH